MPNKHCSPWLSWSKRNFNSMCLSLRCIFIVLYSDESFFPIASFLQRCSVMLAAFQKWNCIKMYPYGMAISNCHSGAIRDFVLLPLLICQGSRNSALVQETRMFQICVCSGSAHYHQYWSDIVEICSTWISLNKLITTCFPVCCEQPNQPTKDVSLRQDIEIIQSRK